MFLLNLNISCSMLVLSGFRGAIILNVYKLSKNPFIAKVAVCKGVMLNTVAYRDSLYRVLKSGLQ